MTMDAGTLCLQATDALNFDRPRSFFTPLDFGLVGFFFFLLPVVWESSLPARTDQSSA